MIDRHAMEVAYRFNPLYEPEKFQVALLHDVIEENFVTAADLLEVGVPASIVQSVVILTRDPDETYRDYIGRVKFDTVATHVKIADLEVNLARMDDEHITLKPRYTWALAYLRGMRN